MHAEVQVSVHDVPVETFEKLASVFEARESDGCRWVTLSTPEARVTMFREPVPVAEVAAA